MTTEQNAVREEKIKRVVRKVAPPLMLLILLGFSLKGSIELYQARSDLASRTKQIQQIGAQTSADFNAINECNKHVDQKTYAYTPAWRSCMIEKLPLLKSTAGVFLALFKSSEWLKNNPADTELQAAANKTLESGWYYLQQNRSLYDSVDRYISAMQNVPMVAFMVALDHRFSAGRPMVEYQTKMLDDAELHLNARTVNDKQIARRIAFIQGRLPETVK